LNVLIWRFLGRMSRMLASVPWMFSFFVSDNSVRLNVCKLEAIIDLLGKPIYWNISSSAKQLFELWRCLEDSARLHPVFTSLDFATIIYLRSKVVSLACVQPQTWRTRPLYLCPTGTGFPFRRLLRLAGLRWRYSIPPLHGTHTHTHTHTHTYIDIYIYIFCVNYQPKLLSSEQFGFVTTHY
jgi:hypothetical protein